MTTTAKITEATEMNLPALTGSEKQIAWATDIRAKKLASLKESFDRIQSNVSDDAKRRKNAIGYQALLNVLRTKVESRFWIDNRFTAEKSLIVANNLQDELLAEFERLCNEAGIKADVKAEKKPAEAKAEVKAEEKAEVKAEVKVETDDTKMTTTAKIEAGKTKKSHTVEELKGETIMAEISFEPFTLIGDDGKFILNEDGGKIVGVLLTGDTIPRGEKFFELPTENDVEVAIAMLKEYVSRKKASGICGVRPGGGILVGVVPQDFDDDTYKEFVFSTHDAECTAFDLVTSFCKYQFGYDSTNDDWESPLTE